MSEILIEIGFDWNAGSLNRLLGESEKQGELILYPLQHGFVRNPEIAGGTPMWPTQLVVGDQVRFQIFDITRASPASQGEGRRPTGIEAYFQHPERPEEAHDIFLRHKGPIRVSRFEALEACYSRVFGHFEKQAPEQGCFPSWLLGSSSADPLYTLAAKGGDEIRRAFFSILLQVEDGKELRTFAFDPELYVGPYGGGKEVPPAPV